jgi:hypothetical protein
MPPTEAGCAGAVQALFGDPGNGLCVVSETDAMQRITEAAKTPVTTHPWTMAETLHTAGELSYKRLTVFNQDANNCAGHATSKAIDAFTLTLKWLATIKELTPFESYVPWIWGVGKNEAGQPGTDGATMGAMLAMVTRRGILPTDTPGLPPYAGTSNAWARNYGKDAKNAPYSKYWNEAKQYIVTAAQLPKDDEAFYLACKAGYTIAFGTSEKIVMAKSQDVNRRWSVNGKWMHAMAAYGYNETLDAVGIDNSHGDGLAWATRDVLRAIIAKARYFDAFVILDIQPRKAGANWSLIGRN